MKKHFSIIAIFLFIFVAKGQNTFYEYYIHVSNYNNAHTFIENNGLMMYSGADANVQNFYNSYEIQVFKQAFPEYVKSNKILNIYYLKTTSPQLINDLISNYPSLYLSYTDLTNKFVEPLNYYPNDFGTTTPGINAGADVTRKELDYIGAPIAWDITKGNDRVLIGISDTAFDTTSPDFNNDKVTLLNAWSTTAPAHGTDVAAIAAARGNNSHGSVGVCMDCTILASPLGFGDISSYTAFNTLFNLASNGARVINMSWHNGTGHLNFMQGYRQEEQDVINYLVDEFDVVFVGAAGNRTSFSTPSVHHTNSNGDPETPFGMLYIYPASYDNVFSVSSVNHKHPLLLPLTNDRPSYCCTSSLYPIHGNIEDAITNAVSARNINIPEAVHLTGFAAGNGLMYDFTFNELVDIVTPGRDVFQYSHFYNGLATYGGGTSYSAPLVSGTLGLMFSRYDCLKSNEATDILQLTSKDIESGSLNQNYRGLFGSGKLEVGNSVQFVDEMVKTNGIARISDHVFNRFDFDLQKINNNLSIENVTFRDDCRVNFVAKNQIHLLPDTSLIPNINGAIHLSINPAIDVACTPSNFAKNSNTNQNNRFATDTKSSISLYPNPNNGSFQLLGIKSEEFASDTVILQVFDLNGRVLYKRDLSEKDYTNCKVDLNYLSQGIYIVKIASINHSVEIKFVKN